MEESGHELRDLIAQAIEHLDTARNCLAWMMETPDAGAGLARAAGMQSRRAGILAARIRKLARERRVDARLPDDEERCDALLELLRGDQGGLSGRRAHVARDGLSSGGGGPT